ncbi:MAG: hypothetical protein DWB56_02725 [Candidatus Jettenia sp.]|uniref:Uncharacterized protein n=1 Tax=Candidatus Jettenia caeni TaxID=247490 RepID=I3IGR3_9BACT|nr:hypothetical protein [Candidatus Jettenia sp. AMX1]MBC6927871.1 hypothetical protein [Candidatus Jettenia sp.]GAB60908.1 hypothetical protein KSU1_B0051 [Candidatus Jettenia caeni]KAA0251279.1 MAG: hypothetical protein EDM77_02005 [Candidatus Jettenia sp. AMX1]MCE7880303.1 hypothetical protein [Candidatus Jettenia sp. AMX1]MCQ3926164.1 hypothetical protein [Candidatus Jettenia sp.]
MERVNIKWCPLYGKLPALLDQTNEVTKTSLDIIHKARTLFNPELHRIAHRLFKKLLNTRYVFAESKPLSPEGLRLLEVALINKTLIHLIPKKNQKRIDKPIKDYHILGILAIRHAFIALQANSDTVITNTLGINAQEEIDYARALVKGIEEYCGMSLEPEMQGQANGQDRGIKEPEINIFRKEGEYWTIQYNGKLTKINDCFGLRYIAYLLENKDKDFYVHEVIREVNKDQFQRIQNDFKSKIESKRQNDSLKMLLS